MYTGLFVIIHVYKLFRNVLKSGYNGDASVFDNLYDASPNVIDGILVVLCYLRTSTQ